MMREKRIVVGVSGGIAAYKTAALVSQLTQKGADVRVIMTEAATQFITPLTLQTLSRNPVAINTFEEKVPEKITHIDLADHSDLFVIAPATANLISKIAHGIGDDMITTTILATRAPVCIVPAMNGHMFENPVIQENMNRLRSLGFHFIEPNEGQLACGYVGKGRMAEPEEILNWIEQHFQQRTFLAGKKVLITAGPTIEPLDPVRYFSNYSSGKMGYALARAAKTAGADVILVSGPTKLIRPKQVEFIEVKRAIEMKEIVMSRLQEVDVIIKAAAVADYRPRQQSTQKIKKQNDVLQVELIKNPDIAVEIGQKKRANQLFVGFAAETEQLEIYAKEKLKKKKMDLIVANPVSRPDVGFESDENQVTIFDHRGKVLQLRKQSKEKIATEIISLIGERMNDR